MKGLFHKMPDLSSIFPKDIRSIAVVSPASQPKKKEIIDFAEEFEKKTGIKVKLSKNIFATQNGKLPASEKLRLADLNAAICDTEIDLILCSRGGYGSAQLLEGIKWDILRERNLPILGYSDITAIHLAMLAKKAGVPISSPMANKFFRCAKYSLVLKTLARALTPADTPRQVYSFPDSKILKRGARRGKVIPANLAVLCSFIGTKYLPDLANCILLIEDIAEEEYKIDRMLTQLELAGILNSLSGLLFGSFTRCGNQATLRKIFAKFTKQVNGPVLSGIPFGHIQKRICLRFGQEIEILSNGAIAI